MTSILELWCMIISATSREQDARVSNPHHTINPNILGICNCFENPFPPYILIIWYILHMHGRLTFASHEYTVWGSSFLVDFWELSHLTRDLSQVEKKINVATTWATDKMTKLLSLKMTTSTILSEIHVILCICSTNNIS